MTDDEKINDIIDYADAICRDEAELVAILASSFVTIIRQIYQDDEEYLRKLENIFREARDVI